MATRPKIRLSRLRDIGWSHWDPIGLKAKDGGAADEYDRYLLRAASMLRNSEPGAADYLVHVESEHMGLGVDRTTQSRAEATIEAMRNAKDLWSDR